VGWSRDHGKNQGQSRHHVPQGASDDRTNHVAHSSGSALASHVFQEGVAHGACLNTQINEIVSDVSRSPEKVIRPPVPTDVSVCKDIMSCFSFLFLGVVRHYVKRPFSCWYKTCSCV
jgi:hypothetical protein